MIAGAPLLNQEERVDYLLFGEVAWLISTKLPLHGANGEVIGLVGINYDITPRKLAEEALMRANETAEESARELEVAGLDGTPMPNSSTKWDAWFCPNRRAVASEWWLRPVGAGVEGRRAPQGRGRRAQRASLTDSRQPV